MQVVIVLGQLFDLLLARSDALRRVLPWVVLTNLPSGCLGLRPAPAPLFPISQTGARVGHPEILNAFYQLLEAIRRESQAASKSCSNDFGDYILSVFWGCELATAVLLQGVQVRGSYHLVALPLRQVGLSFGWDG